MDFDEIKTEKDTEDTDFDKQVRELKRLCFKFSTDKKILEIKLSNRQKILEKELNSLNILYRNQPNDAVLENLLDKDEDIMDIKSWLSTTKKMNLDTNF